jgi:hypothetical protein
MADDTLSMLAREVRSKTLRLIDTVDDEQARFTAPGMDNSILWHAGHSLVVVESLGVGPVTGKQPGYPADWFDKFSWKSAPATVTTWPTIEQVRAALRNQLEQLLAAIQPLTAQELDRVVDPTKNRTLRYSVLHGFHDEAGHQGEIHLIKKLYAKR